MSNFYVQVEQMKRLVRLGRPQNCRFAAILLTVLAVHFHLALLTSIWLIVLYCCLYQLAAILNNIVDIKADSINQRLDNPLVKNQLSASSIKYYVVALSFSSLVFSWLIGSWQVVLIVILTITLSAAYTIPKYGLVRYGLAGAGVLAYLYAGIPILFFAAAKGSIDSHLVRLAFIISFLTLPYLLAKDYKDEKGDRAVGKATPLVRYGAKRLLTIVLVVSICSVLVSLLSLNSYMFLVLMIVLGVFYIIALQTFHKIRARKLRLPVQLLLLLISVLIISQS